MTVLTPPSTDERRSRRRRKAQRAALWCLLLLWILWLVENLIGEKNAWVAVLTYVPQFPILIFPLVLLGLALRWREWRAISLNIVSLAFWLIWGMGFVVPLRWPVGSHQTYARIKVMSFNILAGQWGVERVAQVVKRENPDVICFQEARSPQGGLFEKLRTALPGYHVARAREVATFSRFPFEAQKPVMLPDKTGRAFLVTVLKVPGYKSGFHRVRLVNAHFTSVQVSGLRRLGVRGYVRQVNKGVQLREQQRAQLVVAAQDYPGNPDGLLIMGDFNTPPRGRLYRDLASRWQDAFRSAGSGLGHTYSSRLPLIRIDYAWANAKFVVRRCLPLDPVGISSRGKRGMASDHRPLIAELDLLP